MSSYYVKYQWCWVYQLLAHIITTVQYPLCRLVLPYNNAVIILEEVYLHTMRIVYNTL